MNISKTCLEQEIYIIRNKSNNLLKLNVRENMSQGSIQNSGRVGF